MYPDILELSVLDKARSSFKGVIPYSCLDTPTSKHLGSKSLNFAGWFIKARDKSEVYLLIRNGEIEHQIRAVVERRDVLRIVLKVSEDLLAEHPQLCCGFNASINVDLTQPVEVSLVVDGEEYPWRLIQAAACGFQATQLQHLWTEFNNSKSIKKLLGDQSVFLSKISDDILDDIVFRGVKVANLWRVVAGDVPVELKRSVQFLKYVSTSDFCINAVQTAISKGSVIVPDPFSYGMAFCNESYVMSNEINVLRFVSSTGEAFFIFQRVGSADAIYFPTKNMIVLSAHMTDGIIKEFIYWFIRNLEEVNNYSSGDRDFSGVIASHGRPYHFYYDVAPAVSDLYEAQLLDQVPNIVYFKGGDFCSFSELFKLGVPELILTAEELWKLGVKGRGFYFHAGTLFDPRQVESVTRFDRKFISFARNGLASVNFQITSKLMSCYPLIWFGVTVQKRSWLEQVDAAVKILNALKCLYPKVGVVFDGWTSPVHATTRDQRETELDSGVVAKIKEGLDSTIPVFSVVGADSVTKIQFASFVDAYVGNSATGGLHIARFAGRPGVAHLNTKMLTETNHIRKRTKLIDAKHIVDRPEDADLRMDFISYSLNWQVVYDELVQVIEGVSK